jgi:hypothetical protein
MPGYIMHLCHANSIIDILNLRDDDIFCQSFITGCLIPDATDNKELTHFRPSWQQDKITKYPDIHLVTDKISISEMNACDLGILAHLVLDYEYVCHFWDSYFQFEDKNNNLTSETQRIDHVRMGERSLQKASSTIPFGDFFTFEYFYGEYDATNNLFIEDFHLKPPMLLPCTSSILPPGTYNIERLKSDLNPFFSDYSTSVSSKIFPYGDLKEFIIHASEVFLNLLSTSKETL